MTNKMRGIVTGSAMGENRMHKKLKPENIGITKILISCFLLLSLIPVITTSWATYLKSKNIIHNNSAQYVVQMLTQTIGKIELRLKQTSNDVSFLIDPITQEYMKQEDQVPLTYQAKKQLSEIMVKSMISTGGINSVLYSREGRLLAQDQVQPVPLQLSNELMAEVKALDGKVYWDYGGDNYQYKNKKMIRAIRLVKNMLGPSVYPTGFFSYFIREETIFDMIKELRLGRTGTTLIVDGSWSILSSQDRGLVGTRLSGNLIQSLQNRSEGTIMAQIAGRDYFVAFFTSPAIKWKAIGLIPLNEMTPGLNDVQNSTIIWLAFWIVFAFLLSYIITRGITKPIKKLIRGMQTLEAGNFSAQLDLKSNREIFVLSNSFNKMVQRLKQLIEQIYEKELKEKHAELRALQAQINPHFLYNTLDALYWMLYIRGEEKVADMVVSMSKILRYSIGTGDQFVRLHDEIENVQNYIHIQTQRYGDRLSVEINSEPALDKAKVIKLIVQPIVENAIKHGIESIARPGWIKVHAERRGHDLFITVSDNGIGVSPEQLHRYQEHRKIGNGFGIQNVHERIRLTYGEPYGLEIESEQRKGTVITIHLPVLFD